MKNRFPLKISVFLIVVLFLASCEQLGLSKKESPKPTKTVIVLSDLTPSTRNVRSVYIESFSKVLEKVNGGDAIVVGKITDSSITEANLPVNQVVKKFNPKEHTDNPIVQKKEQAKTQDDVKKKKEEIKTIVSDLFMEKDPTMKGRKINQTDIMSSLLVADKVFRNYNKDRNILIICSDMIEESSRYNFERETLTEKRIGQIIAKERSGGRLPNFQNVKVYVVAAGAKRGDKFFNAQKFWIEYMKTAGAQLAGENYASVLVNFEE